MVYTQEELDPLTGKYKKYFDLIIVKRDIVKYSEGFSYKVRYKIDLTGTRIPQGKATYTTKTALVGEAVKLGFDNRLEVLRNYAANKIRPERGKAFYKMLISYYDDDSKFLLDDTAANKREVVYKSRKEARAFIENDLIPYLQEKKINHIQDITVPIYNGFKIYLQAKGVKDKTINNRLIYLTRILEYHLRNGLLEKPPYTKGTTLLKISGKQEKEDAEVLPIEKLKGIYPHKKLIDPIMLINFMNPTANPLVNDELSIRERKAIFNFYIIPFTIGILAMNTGMRNSEVARIRREDFIGVKEKETFLLRVWNKKTEYFNKTTESKYRKIPLHAYTIEAVKLFIQRKEELYGTINDTDFLFGKNIVDKDTGKDDGFLHSKTFDKVVFVLLKLIKHKKDFSAFFSNEKELINKLENVKSLQEELKEMKDAGKGISFYSFRKTFRTMLGLKNDLAEYYMGHKLGNDAKTTYIQVNSLDNKLFVEEYAAPVISMLDRFVFFSEDELKKLANDDKTKSKEKIDFLASKIGQGASLQDAFVDYAIKEYKSMEKSNDGSAEGKGYFERI
ncbi:MAG: phage integrase SAM-like domain-containing protein [Treponema sp.]|nr:phage integrase SAM-like domain-containing protein [Treponema sp.]